MSDRRFFAFPEGVNLKSGFIKLPEEEAFHAFKVLRLKEGDSVEVIDGKHVYSAQIERIKKDELLVRIISYREAQRRLPEIVLCQSFVKGKKADFIVEKATEMGADEILFFPAEYSVGDYDEKKLKRFEKVSREAAKQSKRDYLPQIKIMNSLYLPALKSDEAGILFDPYAEESIRNAALNRNKDLKKVYIFVGPEGGFSRDEVRRYAENNVRAYRFDTPVLRAETAALAALALGMFIFRV